MLRRVGLGRLSRRIAVVEESEWRWLLTASGLYV